VSSQGIWWEDLLQTVKVRWFKNDLTGTFQYPTPDAQFWQTRLCLWQARTAWTAWAQIETTNRQEFETWVWTQVEVSNSSITTTIPWKPNILDHRSTTYLQTLTPTSHPITPPRYPTSGTFVTLVSINEKIALVSGIIDHRKQFVFLKITKRHESANYYD
jgi:hypothetical protein